MPSKKAWLIKSEPDCFSIQHLAKSPQQTTCWSGVRNYQARNFMREMKQGDRVLYYHSSADPPAVVGTATVVREAYPDHTALDARENPIWEMVDIRLEEIFPRELALEELRGLPALAKMELLRRGSRLSVQPVTPAEFEAILKLAHAGAPAKTTAAKPRPPRKPVAAAARSSRPAAKKLKR